MAKRQAHNLEDVGSIPAVRIPPSVPKHKMSTYIDPYEPVSSWNYNPGKVHTEFYGSIFLDEIKYDFHYVEREWNPHPSDKNPPEGHLCEIIVSKNSFICKAEGVSFSRIVYATSFEGAMKSLKHMHNQWTQIKDLTREEYEEWKKANTK